ncbi:indole-3-glycerol phosphate synthase [Geosporobacter subterraneus DSM 17957]|uniref:Indole-3-glycerol phosphate synthase n=1 Tax=Geosporobacter subterraneus DSM 17957 TaxID=1121919 RepID=A0A1M6L4L3_9FIRM|nr:indole-3-glycerol phosphate synthase TrpC [Geosporobacter subterraneus]SHJ66113.1 indole-3-glycerol phosphate synthase [Geosporobacter subterraneus DSM 17957]
MILDKIIRQKRLTIEKEKMKMPLHRIFSILEEGRQPLDFKRVLKNKSGLSIIAEVKRASPSRGVIREDFNPLDIARIYHQNKVEAISVLTEEDFFQGSSQYLSQIRRGTDIPLLRKDFIIEPYQIYQSKALGADAILLITAVLSIEELILFQRSAKEIGLQCLVEVHNQKELEVALEADAEIIGINNRDLKTFETDLETTADLMKKMPKGKIIVSESGIHTREDMKYLESLGVDGVLIGESLMRADSIGDKIRELRGVGD